MGKINGVDLSLFQGGNEKRRAAQKKFAAELYVAGSFFKQRRFTEGDKNTPLAELDARIVSDSTAPSPMPHPELTHRFIAEREKMPKFPNPKK